MRPSSSRRQFLAVVGTSTTIGLAGCAGSSEQADEETATTTTNETATGDERTTETTADESQLDSVGLETLATGFEVPLDVAFSPDADRRYVADQRGLVSVHESGGLHDEPFLDLRDTIATSGNEMGLLGIALHPEFADNRRVFVRYSAPLRSGMPSDYSHTFVLAEFEATDDGRRAKRDSERIVLEIPEPQSNHNAGDIVFGPDGYLYVAVGDGGAGGDSGTGHVEDWYERLQGGNGQDVTENLLGSILRIDVDRQENGRGYAIPDDNPLVGRDGLDEHYAWGLRNPWRMSFDEGRFFVADVGQRSYEEVSLVEKGGNYGWNVKEGTHCYRVDDCPDETPESVRGGEPLLDPIIEYPHSDAPISGASVIGGYVYRGSALPQLTGTYLFADLAARGRLFAATPAESDGAENDGELWPTRVVEVAGTDAEKLQRVYSFGRDADGEMYVLGNGNEGGGFHRIVPAE